MARTLLVLLTLCLASSTALAARGAADPRAAEAATEYVEVDGRALAFRSIGTGPPLVLLTRFRGTLDTWDPLFLDALATHHRVIAIDYPGVGYSRGTLPADLAGVAELMHAAVTKLGVRRYAVLGWSWGGIVAQALLLQHPEAVSHAVLVGTAPPGQPRAEVQKTWLERALKPVNDLADEEVLFFEPRSEASRAAARQSHDRIYARPGIADRIPSEPSDFTPLLAMAGEFGADASGRRARLTASTTPMLILCGDNDPSVPASNWYPLIGQIPRGQLVVLPGAGHGPQHQYPELAAAYIRAFLEQR